MTSNIQPTQLSYIAGRYGLTFSASFRNVVGLGMMAVSILAAGASQASTIDISSQVNANLSGYYNGSVYPPNGGPITIGGIDFQLASYPGGGTGVVQASTAPNQGLSFTFAVGQANVQTVYTIINSAFGSFGSNIGSLTFIGSGGANYVYGLVEGDNVRDHATTQFNTIAPNVYATRDFGAGDRLDVQEITLPSAFASQTLLSVTLTATNNGGLPFIAAITTNAIATPPTIPLPSSAPMLGAALVVVGAIGYRLKQRAPSA